MKSTIQLIILLLLAIVLAQGNASADGLPMKNGKYAGEIILIELSKQQQIIIKNNYVPWGYLELTDEQREIIKKKTSITPPPTKLMVVKIEHTTGECTCGVSNLGLIVGPSKIEIPTKYIYTDKEAGLRKIID